MLRSPPWAFPFQADLGADSAAQDFWAAYDKAAAEAGVLNQPLHVIVNNAGVTLRGAIEDFSREDFLTQRAIRRHQHPGDSKRRSGLPERRLLSPGWGYL